VNCKIEEKALSMNGVSGMDQQRENNEKGRSSPNTAKKRDRGKHFSSGITVKTKQTEKRKKKFVRILQMEKRKKGKGVREVERYDGSSKK